MLITALPALAQTATLRDNTILRDGTPYARIQASGAAPYRNFSFRTLAGKEFGMMTYDDAAGDYRLVFFPGEEQTRLAERYGSAAVMAQEIVDNNLVENGVFNPAGLRRFMLAHPASASPGMSRERRASGPVSKSGEKSTSETIRDIDDELEQAADDVSEAILNIGDAIERAFEKDSVRRAERRLSDGEAAGAKTSRVPPLIITDSEVRRGATVLATYEIKRIKGEDMYTFHNPAGDVVAQASVLASSPRMAQVETLRDGISNDVSVAGTTARDKVVEIARWLDKHNHL